MSNAVNKFILDNANKNTNSKDQQEIGNSSYLTSIKNRNHRQQTYLTSASTSGHEPEDQNNRTHQREDPERTTSSCMLLGNLNSLIVGRLNIGLNPSCRCASCALINQPVVSNTPVTSSSSSSSSSSSTSSYSSSPSSSTATVAQTNQPTQVDVLIPVRGNKRVREQTNTSHPLNFNHLHHHRSQVVTAPSNAAAGEQRYQQQQETDNRQTDQNDQDVDEEDEEDDSFDYEPVLTKILNEKKLALSNLPDVLQFLRNSQQIVSDNSNNNNYNTGSNKGVNG